MGTRVVTEIHFEPVWAPAELGHAPRVIGCATSDAALDYSPSGREAGLTGSDPPGSCADGEEPWRRKGEQVHRSRARWSLDPQAGAGHSREVVPTPARWDHSTRGESYPCRIPC